MRRLNKFSAKLRAKAKCEQLINSPGYIFEQSILRKRNDTIKYWSENY